MPGREVTKQADAKDDSKKKHRERERERERERGREREREKEEVNPSNSEALDSAKRRKRKREKKEKKKEREREKEKEKEKEENSSSSSSSSSSVVVIGEVDKSSLLEWVESGLPTKQQKAKKPKPIDERVWKYVVKSSVVPGVVTPIPTPTPTRALVPVQAPADLGVQKNTRTLQVFAWDRRISVTVTSEAACVSNWLAAQLVRGRGSSFGLDVEWQPNMRKGRANKVAIMQISGAEECLIIQLLYLDSIPEGLPDFLVRSSLTGVGVASDAAKLSQDYGFLCPNTVELTKLASEKMDRKEFMHAGLKALASEILGLQMRKPKTVTMSNWARRNLELAQIEYACLDAWVSFALFSKLETGSV